MKVVIFEKKLNNAELGNGNVHDYYIREDSDFNFDDFHFRKSEMMSFWCPMNNKDYNGIHYEKFANENRIAGFGEFFRDFKVSASDIVKITGKISKLKREYIIDVKKEDKILVLSKSKNGFEILNVEKLNLLNSETTFNNKKFKIAFLQKAKKRSDAPTATDYYEIYLDDVPYDPQIGKIFEIKIDNNKAIFRERQNWKKSVFEIGD